MKCKEIKQERVFEITLSEKEAQDLMNVCANLSGCRTTNNPRDTTDALFILLEKQGLRHNLHLLDGVWLVDRLSESKTK